MKGKTYILLLSLFSSFPYSWRPACVIFDKYVSKEVYLVGGHLYSCLGTAKKNEIWSKTVVIHSPCSIFVFSETLRLVSRSLWVYFVPLFVNPYSNRCISLDHHVGGHNVIIFETMHIWAHWHLAAYHRICILYTIHPYVCILVYTIQEVRPISTQGPGHLLTWPRLRDGLIRDKWKGKGATNIFFKFTSLSVSKTMLFTRYMV